MEQWNGPRGCLELPPFVFPLFSWFLIYVQKLSTIPLAIHAQYHEKVRNNGCIPPSAILSREGRYCSEKAFVSQERVSGFPEKGADLRGSLGTFRGSPGNFRGNSGKLPGNLWIAVKFHSKRTSGEVAGELSGKSGELLGKSKDLPEALPEARENRSDSPNLSSNCTTGGSILNLAVRESACLFGGRSPAQMR